MRLTGERPDIKNITTSVQSAMREENRKRQRHPELGGQLQVLGYDKVWGLIAQIAPVDHAIRTKGMDVAYKELHCLGLGLQVTRPLERCEMDVYAVDLMTFLNDIGILAHLTDTERLNLGLDGTPQRVLLSAVIDVFTGCILGLQIATADTTDLALRTVEMVYLDKQPLADAVGALCPWNMRGHPGTLGVDRGNSYLGDDFYARLAAAGITNLGVPAGKPFLKPWIKS
jgi:putative transposase